MNKRGDNTMKGIVDKEPVAAVICTNIGQRIEGNVFIMAKSSFRFSDFFNYFAHPYVALTDCKVSSVRNDFEPYTSRFLMVRTDQIVTIEPTDLTADE